MGAGKRQADRSQQDAAMSAVVDSGQKRGHGNIDAKEPSRKEGVHRNNHRTMHEFFAEYSGEVLVTRFAAQSYIPFGLFPLCRCSSRNRYAASRISCVKT